MAQSMRLEGSPEIGIPPELAGKVCESIGGNLATLTEQNRPIFEKQLFDKCDSRTGFCARSCVYQRYKDIGNRTESRFTVDNLNFGAISTRKSAITQPIFLGDTMHIRMDVPDQSMEVLYLSYSPLEDALLNSSIKIIFELSIFANYIDPWTKVRRNGITVGTGDVVIPNDNGRNSTISKDLSSPIEYPTDTPINGTIDLTLKFNTELRLEITSRSLFRHKPPYEVEIVRPLGRVYLTKYYEQTRLVNVFFTRGNCTKDNFQWSPPNDTDGFVNCLWTRPTTSIPVYSCRMASYAACENVPVPMNSTTGGPLKMAENETESYFFAHLVDHEIGLIGVSLTSVCLLIGSIVLQMAKMREKKAKGDDKGKKGGGGGKDDKRKKKKSKSKSKSSEDKMAKKNKKKRK